MNIWRFFVALEKKIDVKDSHTLGLNLNSGVLDFNLLRFTCLSTIEENTDVSCHVEINA